MNRLQLSLLSAVAMGTWAAAACSISDRHPVQERDAVDNDGGGDGGDSNGGSGNGGTGGRSNGGAGGRATTGGRNGGGTTGTGGSTGTGGTVDDTELAAAILSFAQANCAAYERCAPIIVPYTFGDLDNCVERTGLANAYASVLPDVNFDAAGYRACAKVWQNIPCASIFAGGTPDACKAPGNRKNGADCNYYAQCESMFCSQTGEWDCGTCAAPPGENAACANGSCADGLSCGTDTKCHAFLKEGAACPSDGSRVCPSPQVCIASKCVVPPKNVGDDCSVNYVCDPTAGLYCDVAGTGTCQKLTFIKAGDACSTDTICRNNGSCTTNVCVEGPLDGDPCNPSAGLGCAFPSECLGGYCTPPDEVLLCPGDQ